MALHVTKKLPDRVSGNEENIPHLSPDAPCKEDLLSSVLKKLSELEEKVNTLQAKPSEMPYEKEELLNAAVCRVDALEAELISTKKVLILWYNLLIFTTRKRASS